VHDCLYRQSNDSYVCLLAPFLSLPTQPLLLFVVGIDNAASAFFFIGCIRTRYQPFLQHTLWGPFT
jgi:hypothetical protein